ncbi:MAG: phosphoenolpyruvate carboxylase [Saprospiraceae bacterium]|nr:phosphoenolpyruvate carboxylase [Saprospiraceae bacterium]
MSAQITKNVSVFHNEIALKFQLYNSLFLSLPFTKVEKTGILLSMFLAHCEEGFYQGHEVPEILSDFFDKQTTFTNDAEKADLLFRFIQYIERQIVLFDALEDSAYSKVNDMYGQGTLKQLEEQIKSHSFTEEDFRKLDGFAVRLVLTAHPTQFYPGSVLGIINDLSSALKSNDTETVNLLLQQLGKTAFLNKEKPTPFDEAMSLIWYLENVFYQCIGNLLRDYHDIIPFSDPGQKPFIRMGFWPGGDRDGNPFVRAETTWNVSTALHTSLFKCYYRDIRMLRRRLTFKGVDPIISQLESKIYKIAYYDSNAQSITQKELTDQLQEIIKILQTDHDGLFISEVENLIHKIAFFGLHFAFLDIRQENEVHIRLIDQLREKDKATDLDYINFSEDKKLQYLKTLQVNPDVETLEDPILKDTIDTIRIIKKIQESYGESACNRYIISQCTSVSNIMEVFTLFRICGWNPEEITVDIVPLFETVDDLIRASEIMTQLYELDDYKAHLQKRNNKQTIMLGFSDGTKDGGYLMANWMIYKAKKALSQLSEKYGIDVLFFDGRGGPPARGGGKTHKFYASLDKEISSREIQLTIQGQTISSNFGIIDSARFNIEQLIHAGISNNIFSDRKSGFSEGEEQLITRLAEISLESYKNLKNHPDFMDYMTGITPLKYFGMTNIGSRPAKRGHTDKLTLKDLRAIPFVASWNMIKQNVPGFYGLGTALEQLEKEGRFEELQQIYQKSLFFRTLMDNSEMTLFKSFFPLTAHVKNDPVLGPVRKMIESEYQRSVHMITKLGNHSQLMQEYPIEQMSIQLRERIVLPLVTIQQFALDRLRNLNESDNPDIIRTYEKMVIRCSFGIINAGRNSA